MAFTPSCLLSSNSRANVCLRFITERFTSAYFGGNRLVLKPPRPVTHLWRAGARRFVPRVRECHFGSVGITQLLLGGETETPCCLSELS
ncbi:hypothetical protein SRHO_G00061820 [Serrasalmus rhombeus]